MSFVRVPSVPSVPAGAAAVDVLEGSVIPRFKGRASRLFKIRSRWPAMIWNIVFAKSLFRERPNTPNFPLTRFVERARGAALRRQNKSAVIGIPVLRECRQYGKSLFGETVERPDAGQVNGAFDRLLSVCPGF